MLVVVEVDKLDEVDKVVQVEEKIKMVGMMEKYSTKQEEQSSGGL